MSPIGADRPRRRGYTTIRVRNANHSILTYIVTHALDTFSSAGRRSRDGRDCNLHWPEATS